MVNTFSLSLIRLAQRLFMLLMLSCCTYVVFFLFSKDQDNPMPNNNAVASKKGVALIAPVPVFNLKPYDASVNVQARDIFSLASVNPSGVVENTPKGQLPNHLKVVGILIAHPSQIVIEDTFSNTTYFIDQENPQDGIKIVKVGRDQMTINYQGQDIILPVNKD